MGEVFLAEDTKLDRSAALRLPPEEVAAGPFPRRKRFLAEASVRTINEVGETVDGQSFIAME